MIIQVRHELISFDLAHAVALEAESEEETRLGRQIRIAQLTKTEIRQIGTSRLLRSGEAEYWPEILEDGLFEYARGRVDGLWPKGA